MTNKNPYNAIGCPICNEYAVASCRCGGKALPHKLEDLKRGHGYRCPNGHNYSTEGLSYDSTKELNEAIAGLDIKPVSRDEVLPFFIENHYLAKPPTNTQLYLGIFFNNELIGTITYGYPVGPTAYGAIAKKDGQSILTNQNVFELTRLFVKDVGVKNIESSVISRGNQLVHDTFPNVKVIITYADPSEGHVGTVYQATGAIYQGKGSDTNQLFDKDTKSFPRKAAKVAKFGTSKTKEILAGGHPVELVKVGGKMRYVYIIRNKKEIEPYLTAKLPYVKYDDKGQQNFPFKYKDMAKEQHINEEINKCLECGCDIDDTNENHPRLCDDCWYRSLDSDCFDRQQELNEYGDTGTGMGQYSSGMAANSVGTYSSPAGTQDLNKFNTNHPNMYYPVGTNKVDTYNNYRATAPDEKDIKKLKKTVTPDEILAGMDFELKRQFFKNKSMAKQKVVDNLKRDPEYYSSLRCMGIEGDDKQLSETKTVIKETMNINDDLKVSVSAVQKIIDEMIAKRNPEYKKCDEKIASAYKHSIETRKERRKENQADGWFSDLL